MIRFFNLYLHSNKFQIQSSFLIYSNFFEIQFLITIFAETNTCIYGKLHQIRLGDETPA